MMEIIIDHRVIKHLGKDLITSSDVAVVELVKNSIDAKASRIDLQIYDALPPDHNLPEIILDEWIPQHMLASPILIVSDDGCGMTDAELQKGFLTVGTNIKESDGTLLGAKGIGRLATQRLGTAVLLETSSDADDFTSFVFIDWNRVISGEKEVPSMRLVKSASHTRLWIFGANLDDYIENAAHFQQQTIFPDKYSAYINRDLKAALNFLISPFAKTEKQNSHISINVYYQNKAVDISFDQEMLALAESCHTFSLTRSNDKLNLNCSLELRPWFAERVHRAIVKASAFERLKQPHEYYRNLISSNSKRINAVLVMSMSESDLKEWIEEMIKQITPSFGETTEEILQYQSFLDARIADILSALIEIVPISGVIYSFKQGVAVGERIAIDSAYELGAVQHSFKIGELKRFLDDNNGIKLYRSNYRIGFLGNKENDWIKLQQFRTKGQQWYRFDLGNTMGYVSLTDMSQTKIQEISSRLDISQNKISDAFKLFINLVFNYFFYDLNRKANDVLRVILEEDGKLGEGIGQRVKKNDQTLRRLIENNKRLQKQVSGLYECIEKDVRIEGNSAHIPIDRLNFVKSTISSISESVVMEERMQSETAGLIREASEQLKNIEIESYNNFKLMANGIITEIITHELDSLSKTTILPDYEERFDVIRQCLLELHQTKMYNSYLYPIRNNYKLLSSKMRQVGSMYSFLETTFVHKGTYDEFVFENIEALVAMIEENLFSSSPIENVSIQKNTDGLVWNVPKGVLLHVFYNLFSNSLYWIDIRRKWAQNDAKYFRKDKDMIVIEVSDENCIVVYDTGTGVISSMEDILFEPLQSGKAGTSGRGMGLYIVKKLMNSFGGDIILLPDRNAYGNRYKFLLMEKIQEE